MPVQGSSPTAHRPAGHDDNDDQVAEPSGAAGPPPAPAPAGAATASRPRRRLGRVTGAIDRARVLARGVGGGRRRVRPAPGGRADRRRPGQRRDRLPAIGHQPARRARLHPGRAPRAALPAVRPVRAGAHPQAGRRRPHGVGRRHADRRHGRHRPPRAGGPAGGGAPAGRAGRHRRRVGGRRPARPGHHAGHPGHRLRGRLHPHGRGGDVARPRRRRSGGPRLGWPWPRRRARWSGSPT